MLIMSKLDLALYFEIDRAFEKTQIIMFGIFFNHCQIFIDCVPSSILGTWNASMNKTKT